MITDIAITLARRFAPNLIGRLLGGGAAAESLGGRLVDAAMAVTGLSDPAEAAAALENDPAAARAYRSQIAEQNHEYDMAALADVDAARQMRLELARQGKTDWMMYVVAVITVLGLVIVTCAVFFASDLTERQTSLLQVMGGGLLAGFIQVLNYFFGSSKGSSDKTRLMSLTGGGRGGA